MEKKDFKNVKTFDKKLIGLISLIVIGGGAYFYSTMDLRKIKNAKSEGKSIVCVSWNKKYKAEPKYYSFEEGKVKLQGVKRLFKAKHCVVINYTKK